MVLILVVFLLYIVVFQTPTLSHPRAGRHREAHGYADRARPDTRSDEGTLTALREFRSASREPLKGQKSCRRGCLRTASVFGPYRPMSRCQSTMCRYCV